MNSKKDFYYNFCHRVRDRIFMRDVKFMACNNLIKSHASLKTDFKYKKEERKKSQMHMLDVNF